VTSVAVEMLQMPSAKRWTSDVCAMRCDVEVTQTASYRGKDPDMWTNSNINLPVFSANRSSSNASIEVFKILSNQLTCSTMTSPSNERRALNIQSASTLSCCSISTLDIHSSSSSQWRHSDVIANNHIVIPSPVNIPLTVIPCPCGVVVSFNRSDCPMTPTRVHQFPVDPRPDHNYVRQNFPKEVDGVSCERYGEQDDSQTDTSMCTSVKVLILLAESTYLEIFFLSYRLVCIGRELLKAQRMI
jgi:hypothetical protein